MKRFNGFNITWLTALFFIMLAPAAVLGEKPDSDPAPANAAIVNGTAIAYGDFQRELQFYKKRLQGRGVQPQGLDKQVIDDMIGRELIFQESIKKGMKVGPEFIQEEMSAIQLQFEDKTQFEAWLASMNMNEEILKTQISQRQAVRELIEADIIPKVKVTESEAKDFYTKNSNLFQRPEEVHAQHILLKLEPDADDRQKADARKKIAELKKRIDSGEDFGALAKASSDCPSAQNNGDLGFFPRGRMVPAFENAAFELKTGHVSDIVETRFGFHLIKVLERRSSEILKFEEVNDRIQEELRNRSINKEVQELVANLRKKAKIEIFVK
jgi:peptidyl-prolyl cis-trans isomerase C